MFTDGLKLFIGYMPQVFAVITATLGSISNGMQYGWPSPSEPKLLQPDFPVLMNEDDLIWLDSMFFIGALIALPLTSYSADKLGRKPTILIAASVCVSAWFFIAFANSIILLFIGRFLGGFGSDTCYTVVPIYIGEIADKNIRGFLGSFVFINFMIGILIVYSVGPFVSIQNTAFVGLAIPILQIITFSTMPESPYFYLVQNNEKQAKEALTFLRKSEQVAHELKEIKTAVERQEAEHGSIGDLFTVASNRKAIIIVTILYGSQNFSAMTVLFMNLHTILEDAKGIVDVGTAGIIFAAVMLFAALLGSSILDLFGRKNLLNVSCAITGTSLGLICIYFWLKAESVDLTYITWLPAVAVVLYAAGIMSGLGLIPVILAGELFPTSVKCVGITMADFGYLGFGIISIYFHRFVSEAYGIHISFLVYSICSFATILFTIFYIPETMGKTLEEIQLMLKGKNKNDNIELPESTNNIDDLKQS